MNAHSGGDLIAYDVAEARSEPFQERHFPVMHWAKLWGFSPKTVREWFRDEFGPGILRQQNAGRRKRRDYTTLMISATAARRVYTKHTETELIH